MWYELKHPGEHFHHTDLGAWLTDTLNNAGADKVVIIEVDLSNGILVGSYYVPETVDYDEEQ